MIRSNIGKTLSTTKYEIQKTKQNKKEFAFFIDIYYFKKIVLKEFQ